MELHKVIWFCWWKINSVISTFIILTYSLQCHLKEKLFLVRLPNVLWITTLMYPLTICPIYCKFLLFLTFCYFWLSRYSIPYNSSLGHRKAILWKWTVSIQVSGLVPLNFSWICFLIQLILSFLLSTDVGLVKNLENIWTTFTRDQLFLCFWWVTTQKDFALYSHCHYFFILFVRTIRSYKTHFTLNKIHH